MAHEEKNAEESKMSDTNRRRKQRFMVKWNTFYTECIEQIEESINFNVMRRSFTKKQYSEFYTMIFNMCIGTGNNDFSRDLYDQFEVTVKSYIERYLLPVIQNIEESDRKSEQTLTIYCQLWDIFKIYARLIHAIFTYLDSDLVTTDKLKTMTSVLAKSYYECLHCVCISKVYDAIMDFVRMDRNGETIDEHLIKNVIRIIIMMDSAQRNGKISNITKIEGLRMRFRNYDMFEANYIKISKIWFKTISDEWMLIGSVPQYLELAEHQLVEEFGRISKYLNKRSNKNIEKSYLKIVVVDRRDDLIDAVTSILRTCYCVNNTSTDEINMSPENRETLRCMFELFNRTYNVNKNDTDFDLMERMAIEFSSFIIQIGSEFMDTEYQFETNKYGDNPKEIELTKMKSVLSTNIVEKFIHLHKYMLSVVNDIFNESTRFVRALSDAFSNLSEISLNDNEELRLTYFLPAYIDKMMKKGSQRLSESEVESNVNSAFELFCFIVDKDTFIEVFRDFLSQRLLNNKSISNDLEQSIVSKMKAQCGGSFTIKLEGMLTDYMLHEDNNAEYTYVYDSWKHEDEQKDSGINTIDFEPRLLTLCNWPSQKNRLITLPPVMQSIQMHYVDWYRNKHDNARRLIWIHTLGEVTIFAQYEKKRYSILMSPFQAILLLMFDLCNDAISVNDIVRYTGLNDEDSVKRMLHSLFSNAKFKLLNKTPPEMPIRQTDMISVNKSFKSKSIKFRIPMPTLDKKRSIKNTIDDCREYRTEGAIVRIMKARKRMTHEDLKAEVMHQLVNFRPDARFIKKTIAKLIERDYLERDPEDAQFYRYLA